MISSTILWILRLLRYLPNRDSASGLRVCLETMGIWRQRSAKRRNQFPSVVLKVVERKNEPWRGARVSGFALGGF